MDLTSTNNGIDSHPSISRYSKDSMTHGEFCLFANTGLSQKGLGRRIGSSILKRGTRVAALDLDARDADGDLIAQEGTTAAHRVTKKKPKSLLKKIRISAASSQINHGYSQAYEDRRRFGTLASLLGLNSKEFEPMHIPVKNIEGHREKLRRFVNQKFGELKTGSDAHKALSKVFPNADIKIKRNRMLSTHDLAIMDTLLFYGDRDKHLANVIGNINYEDLGEGMGGNIGEVMDHALKESGLTLNLSPRSMYDGIESMPTGWFTASSGLQEAHDAGATDSQMEEYFGMYTVMHEWGHGLHFEAIARKELGITAVKAGAERYEQITKEVMRRSKFVSKRYAILLAAWTSFDKSLDKVENNIARGLMRFSDLAEYQQAKSRLVSAWMMLDSLVTKPTALSAEHLQFQEQLQSAIEEFETLTKISIDDLSRVYDETASPSSGMSSPIKKAVIEAVVQQSSTIDELYANLIRASRAAGFRYAPDALKDMIDALVQYDWVTVIIANAYDKTPEEDMPLVDASLHSVSRYAQAEYPTVSYGQSAFEQFAETFAAKELGVERSAAPVRRLTKWGSTKSILAEGMEIKSGSSDSDTGTQSSDRKPYPFPPIPQWRTCRGLFPKDPVYDGLYGGPKNPELAWVRRLKGKTR